MRSMKRTLKERMNIINESLMSNMHDEKLEAMLKEGSPYRTCPLGLGTANHS
jgi:hypothetical protein